MRFPWLACLVTGAMFVAACGGSNDSSAGDGASGDAKAPFTMARFTAPLMFYAGEVTGAYKDLNVKPVEMDSGPAALPLLVKGSIAGMADVSEPPIDIAIDRNIPIRIVWAGNTTATSIVGRKLTSAAQLKGKKVGAPGGSIAQAILEQFLERNGMDPKQIQFVDLAPPDLVSAYANGSIDAASIWSPQREAILKRGATKLATVALPTYTLFSERFIKEHRDVVQRFVCDAAAVQNRLVKDPRSTWAALSKGLQMPASTVATLVPSKSVYPASEVPNVLGADGAGTRSIAKVGDFLAQRKQVSRAPSVDDVRRVIDTRFAEAAAAGNCGSAAGTQ
jgi:taurine transport system substrate-binding protein